MTQCSLTSTILASIITTIITALLATVIFVLVQIAVCKCHPKFMKQQPASTEVHEYEQMDGGVAVNTPTYTMVEVGAKENTFKLEKNESYSVLTAQAQSTN